MPDIASLLYPEKHKQKYIFFAGKGGVGKTSMACVTAVQTARRGYQTLLLTTDPAAHIGNVLDKPVTDEITAIDGLPNLYAVKIDQKKATEDYKLKIIENAQQRFNQSTLAAMEEELNSPCTEEMAAFQKFIDYTSAGDFDVVVFDTAPTGHTMRLLELPMDWSRQIGLKAGVTTEISVEDQLQKERFDRVIGRMKDPAKTTFAFVMYPEKTPIVEAFRAAQELSTLGIKPQLVVANQIIPEAQAESPFFAKRRNMQLKYLQEIREKFPDAVLVEVPLYAGEIKGLGVLSDIAQKIY